MIPRVRFRYGLDLAARIGLPIWSLGWLIGILCVLLNGEVNSHTVTYTRADDPVWYWTMIGVAAAMVLLGLALTFELSFDKNEDQSLADKDG